MLIPKPKTSKALKTRIIFAIAIVILSHPADLRVIKPDIIFQAAKDSPLQEFKLNYLEESNNNEFMLQIPDLAILKEERVYIWLEAENPELYLNIWVSKRRKAERALQVNNYGGNCLFVLGEGLFNNKLKELRRDKVLFFSVRDLTVERDPRKTEYTIKVLHSKELQLPFGKIFSMMVDPSIEHLRAKLKYNGHDYPHLYKKRIQLNAARTQKDWFLEAFMKTKDAVFKLNPLFAKTVGEVLATPYYDLCKETSCESELDIKSRGIEVYNLETFLIDKTEELSIHHYGNYFDKVYMVDSQTTYKLPYHPDMEGLDVSVTLMPVNDHADLYVNVGPRPISLSKYAFSNKSKLGKKVTIPWSYIEETRAVGQPIFIAVHCLLVGEFLLKVDAHESGYLGSLTEGVVEAGAVNFKQIVNYLYFFEVAETQLIDFDLSLTVVSGNVDLFLLECDDYSTCMIEASDVEGERKGLFKVRDGKALKSINRQFKCRKKKGEASSLCQFSIAALGKEQGASHFEISLHEKRFHRILTPGHMLPIELEPMETAYFKFSVPGRNSDNNKIILSVESLWGHFAVNISKSEPYPTAENYQMREVFESPKSSLFQSLKMIELNPKKFNDEYVEGIYYVSVEAVQRSTINLVYFEKGVGESSIHTLSAGRPIRGEITNYGETMYYTIPVSLVPGQAASIEINLTPLKGRFILMGSSNGRLPTLADHQYFANDNRLQFKAKDARQQKQDYIIAVGLHLEPEREVDFGLKDSFQYSLSLKYTNKPVHLAPGYINSYVISQNNMYLIEVLEEFTDLLILKNSLDGFPMDLCAHFSTTEDAIIDKTKDRCPFFSGKKSVALYFKRGQLKDHCTAVISRAASANPRCFLVLRVKGTSSQLFRLGYTYNERPFRIVKDELFSGPDIIDAHGRVNFVYAVEKNRPAGLVFNSKGRGLKMYSRLVKGGEFDDSLVISFPTSQNFDSENTHDSGNLQSVFYSADEVSSFGGKPELLISIRPDEMASNSDDNIYDPTGYFELQTSLDVVELGRTKTTSQVLQANKPSFFRLYHNGNHDSFKVYIISESASVLHAQVSRGKTSRPGAINTPFMDVKGVGSIELLINEDQIKQSPHATGKDTRGYFVISVKSNVRTHLNVYWNNEININFLELTPNHPSTMSLLSKKKLYFSFYARGVAELFTSGSQSPQPIRLYVQSSVRAEVFLLTSTTGETVTPSAQNFFWKESLGDSGGITMVEINPTDDHYCSDCNYVGYVESDFPGKVTLLANIIHDSLPVELSPGPTFPEYLRANQQAVFSIKNPDTAPIDLSVSILSGAVNVYLSRDPQVSLKNFEKKFSLERHQFAHQFIRIDPKEYAITSSSNWYIAVHNPTTEESAFSLTIYKNDLASPLESGLSKYVHLDASEETHFAISPLAEDKEVRVQIELSRVFTPIAKKDCLERLTKTAFLYQIDNTPDPIPLQVNSISQHQNRLHLSLKLKTDLGKANSRTASPLNWDISQAKPHFGLKLTNQCASPIALTIDLVSGAFKLVNLNQSNFGTASKETPKLYEAYGLKEKFIFIDLKPCLGLPKLSIFQSDFSDLEIDQQTDFQKLSDKHSSVHYMKVKDKRVFFKVENGSDKTQSVFRLNVFNERDMETNPYADVNTADTDFQIEPEKKRVIFDLLQYSQNFKQSKNSEYSTFVTYTLFLSKDRDQIQYAQNCSDERLSEFFESPELHTFTFSQTETLETTPTATSGSIEWDYLEPDSKYYGILVADLHMLPNEPGFLTPIRSERVHFEAFSMFTPRTSAPLTLLISIALIVGLLYLLFLILRGHLFGGFGNLKRIDDNTESEDKKVKNMSFTGMKAFEMLEQVYYTEKRREKQRNNQAKQNANGEVEIEKLDVRVSEENNSVGVEMESTNQSNGEFNI